MLLQTQEVRVKSSRALRSSATHEHRTVLPTRALHNPSRWVDVNPPHVWRRARSTHTHAAAAAAAAAATYFSRPVSRIEAFGLLVFQNSCNFISAPKPNFKIWVLTRSFKLDSVLKFLIACASKPNDNQGLPLAVCLGRAGPGRSENCNGWSRAGPDRGF